LPIVLAGVLGLRVLKGNRGVIKNMGISQVVTTLDKRVSNVNSNTRNFKEKVGSREKFKLGNLIQKTTFKVLNDVHNYWYTTPGNLGNSYAMGFLLLFSIFLQILTGLFLVANYEPSVENAFYSVIWLKRDVFGGGYVQSVHSIGASIIFMALYLHLFRGLYFASYKKRNTWMTGVCIYFLVALIAFLGYCLP
jgi:quinol-cytochrome oxidoreductase complex cytochrome b subunit